MSDAEDIIKGAVSYIGVSVQDGWVKDATVNVTAQTCDVVDVDGGVIQTVANASLIDDETALVFVYHLIDTSAAKFVIGETYKVRFTITIGSAVPKYHRHIKIVE